MLKDATRSTFKLNPERDTDLYIDLEGSIRAIRQALQSAVPKVVIEGDIGTGKTHALHYAAALARSSSPSREPVFLTLSGFESKTNFIAGMHRVLIGQLLELFLRDARVFDKMMAPHKDTDGLPAAARKALTDLRSEEPDKATAARAWLCASRTLTPSKALKAGYSTLLDEVMGPSDLASFYVSLAARWKAVTERTLILFLDESESFSRVVHDDAQASIGAGLRQLFDSTNEHLGVFIGLNTPRVRKGTHPMLRSDVRSRATMIYLPTLQEPALREHFLSALWARLATDPKLPPFMLNDGARRFVLDEIDTIRRRLLRDQSLASPTPRDVLSVLDLIAKSAYQERTKLPLDEDTLRRWIGVPRARALAG